MLDKNKKIKEKINIIYKSEQNEQIRIDKYLFSKLADYSRSYFQKLIEQDLIIVNKKKTKASYTLKENDEIEINIPQEKAYDLSAQKVDFDVIDIQENFIIINKPAGLIVHPSDCSANEVSLVNGLLYKFSELEKLKDNKRPGIVHRLDRGTSGLMIVARNLKAQIKLSQIFKNREVKKIYLAIVKGHPPKKNIIDFSIGRNPFKRHLMTHISSKGKHALTKYKVLEYFKECSLAEVRILTGRTHQIRVHFSAIGHGLIGDGLYGYQSKLINRPALHAHKLSFNYDEQQFDYCLEPPEDFKNLIKNLKK